jgi:phenylpyruvate tautomerase PptA (4-oxalocrotonate tautomerase family)
VPELCSTKRQKQSKIVTTSERGHADGDFSRALKIGDGRAAGGQPVPACRAPYGTSRRGAGSRGNHRGARHGRVPPARPCTGRCSSAGSISNVDGDENDVRVQVLTPIGVLDRDKQLGVVRELTDIAAAAAARDPTVAERTWVLITESREGGWGINGHANTGADVAQAARSELSALADRGADQKWTSNFEPL